MFNGHHRQRIQQKQNNNYVIFDFIHGSKRQIRNDSRQIPSKNDGQT